MMAEPDIIIGIDAGTSVLKAVAFDLSGRQIEISAVRNAYDSAGNGAVTQSMPRTWSDCVAALRGLHEKIDNLAPRVAAISVTGQGDGTWLAGKGNEAVADAWIWLDARAAPTVTELAAKPTDRARFESTGTGLNTCQQGSQMAHMDRHCPELLDAAEVALHCKDWLFLNLTGVRATDPSEMSFTFGDFRTRTYSGVAIDSLGLDHRRHLLPEVLDGSQETRALSSEAAAQTGFLAGTPVSLGYVDMVMTALGAGVHTGTPGAACSTIGSTGVHTRAVAPGNVHLNAEGTGYVICLPVPDLVTQVQTNMAATLNLDWALSLAGALIGEFGPEPSHAALVERIDGWMERSRPGRVIYHPYISEAGERGPFVNANARAGFAGFNASHRFPEILRAVIEGLGMAARDCYAAMGDMPSELRITGGAARSAALRRVLAASLDTPVRVSSRQEAGAAGCAMMAAVAIGAYATMDECISDWTTPLLGAPENPDRDLVGIYDNLFSAYRDARIGLEPVWDGLAAMRARSG